MFVTWLGSNSVTRSSSQERSVGYHYRIFSMKHPWRLIQLGLVNPAFVSICSLFWLPVSRENIFWSFFLATVFLDFTAQVYRNTNKRLRGLFTTFPSRSGDSSREYGTSIKFLRTCVLRTGRKTWDFLTVVPVKALCCPFNKRFSEYQSETLFFLCLCAIFIGK